MSSRLKQRGAATLVVVMVMFLIVAMLAAYANRNQIFEQRVGSNYVRSAVAHEAAEAGLEWALSQLNSGKINAACEPTETGANSFRQRYLGVDSTTGAITPLAPQKDPKTIATCMRAPIGAWQCQCPAPNVVLSNTSTAVGTEAQPTFNVAIEPASRNGVLRVFAQGCNDSQITTCHGLGLSQMAAANAILLSASIARVEAALLSALKVPPAAPLVSKLGLNFDAQGVGLHNSDPRSGGLLYISGETVPSDLPEDRLDSMPGTSGRQALFQDPTLQAVSTDGSTVRSLFGRYFGMPKEAYRQQPAMKRIVPCGADCGPALVAAYAAGARMFWVNGPLVINSDIELGSDTEPVVLVAAGPVTLDGPMRLHGLLYAGGDLVWSNTSGLPALLNGAAVAEGRVVIGGQVDFWYLPAIMDRLSKATGSFVRVPGSWSDMNK